MKPFCSKVETVPQKDETIKIWNQRPKTFNHYYLVCTGLRSNNNRKKFVAFFQKPKKETVVPLSLLQYSLQTPQKCMPSRGTLLSKGPLLSNQNTCFFVLFTFITTTYFVKSRYLSTLTSNTHLWTLLPLLSLFWRRKLSIFWDFLLKLTNETSRIGNPAHILHITPEQMLIYKACQFSSW